MKQLTILIRPFKQSDHKGVDKMMFEINQEFETSIFNTHPAKKPISNTQFWIASHEAEIVGSIGILVISNDHAILRSMFVKASFRGRDINVSSLLLKTVIDWAKTKNLSAIYLGTMTQFKAAHKFYEKNKFQKITSSELPIDFIKNPIDDIYYKLSL